MAAEEASTGEQRYERDEDGFRREIVGPWVRDKHIRLAKYIGISRAVRRKFIGHGKAGATYIDLFSGPGRARIRGESSASPGSPLVAWNEAHQSTTPFTEIFVADKDFENCAAVGARLAGRGSRFQVEMGPAIETVDRIASKLNPSGLHFAFLDPYNLGELPFDVIRKLASFERMDMLIHVSIHDLQRNLRRYVAQTGSPLDVFAPGWRDKVDVNRQDSLVRSKILEYWRGLLRAEGMGTTEVAERVVGSKGQPLYWLAFVARHKRALEFWEKIREVGNQKQMKLL